MCRRFEISLPLLSAGNNKDIFIQYKSSFQVNLNFFAKLEKPLSNLKNIIHGVQPFLPPNSLQPMSCM